MTSCFKGYVRVHFYNQPISDEPTNFCDNLIEHMPKAVVRLVNIFNCLAYGWTFNHD